ncbi:hypothetical protein [Enhygromyxa salina]|nr:hypothetical protein [Enhygromyxa salina]
MERPVRVGLVGVAAAIGLGGCENSDPCEGLRTFEALPEPTASATAPPIVLDGEWIGAGVLELQFSKPLAVSSAPDPNRFAIVGWAAIVQPYNNYNGPDSCDARTRYSVLGQGYYQVGRVSDAWVAPEDASVLRLRMSNSAADCRVSTDIVAEGVLLVYADGGDAGAQLLDGDGDPVPDIGPQWAIQRWEDCIGGGNSYNYCGYSLGRSPTGHLPALTSLAPIPCPT